MELKAETGTVTEWADLVQSALGVAVILALAIVVVYLYRSREKLQQEYRENLITATAALTNLTAEYLEQSYSSSATWQDRLKGMEDRIGSVEQRMGQCDQHCKDRVEQAVTRLALEIQKGRTP